MTEPKLEKPASRAAFNIMMVVAFIIALALAALLLLNIGGSSGQEGSKLLETQSEAAAALLSPSDLTRLQTPTDVNTELYAAIKSRISSWATAHGVEYVVFARQLTSDMTQMQWIVDNDAGADARTLASSYVPADAVMNSALTGSITVTAADASGNAIPTAYAPVKDSQDRVIAIVGVSAQETATPGGDFLYLILVSALLIVLLIIVFVAPRGAVVAVKAEKTVAESESEPTPEPEPVAASEQDAADVFTIDEPVVATAPVVAPEPEPTPVPEPAPVVASAPEPEPAPAPAPEPIVTPPPIVEVPAPAPVVEAAPEPQPEPKPQTFVIGTPPPLEPEATPVQAAITSPPPIVMDGPAPAPTPAPAPAPTPNYAAMSEAELGAELKKSLRSVMPKKEEYVEPQPETQPEPQPQVTVAPQPAPARQPVTQPTPQPAQATSVYNLEDCIRKIIRTINPKIKDKEQQLKVMIDRQVPIKVVGAPEDLAKAIIPLLAKASDEAHRKGIVVLKLDHMSSSHGMCTARFLVEYNHTSQHELVKLKLPE